MFKFIFVYFCGKHWWWFWGGKYAGGLMFKLAESNLQYVTSITFLLSTYAKYMTASKHTFNCGSVRVSSTTLRNLAKQQACSFSLSWISLQWEFFLAVYICFLVLTLQKFSGGLHFRGESIEDVLHGRVWGKLPKENSPQRRLHSLQGQSSWGHRLRQWLPVFLLHVKP